MHVESFDLSVSRVAKPQVSEIATSRKEGYAMVVRCDSPAMLFTNSAASTPVAAYPGLVLENFNSLLIANPPGAGVLTIAYYECVPPGAPSGLETFGARVLLATNAAANVGIDSDISPPGADYGIALTGVHFATTDPADASVASLVWDGPSTTPVFRGLLVAGQDNIQSHWTRPILLPLPGGRVGALTVQTNGGGGVGSTHYVEVFGFYYRARI